MTYVMLASRGENRPFSGWLFEWLRRRCLLRPKFLLLALLVLASLAAQGQYHFRVLHSFGAGTDGSGVWDGVTLDASGNIYGATSGGGSHNDGIIFQLTPHSSGRWTETILHTFPSSPDDGGGPWGGVVLDSKGNLYGTTISLGRHDSGIAFSLAPDKPGWREKILHSFCSRQNCNDGGAPWGSLIADPKGDLFGTGYVAFELTPGQKGWTDVTLHDFTGKNSDGWFPMAGPIRDAAGNLYGTTLHGGGGPLCADGCGTVWQLQPPASEESAPMAWTEHILHRFGFSDSDGVWPGVGQLAIDAQGNLYGTANGGKYRAGVVYKLARPAAGSDEEWQETILYNFTGRADGAVSAGVIFDHAGNLYGTTAIGGASECRCGVVFKLSPRKDGSWKYTLLHTFVGTDGAEPNNNLTLGPDGNLYGTAATGGAYGGGVVFELTP